jgi:hypothetical protein
MLIWDAIVEKRPVVIWLILEWLYKFSLNLLPVEGKHNYYRFVILPDSPI